ncbi:hypothetical protein AB0H64_24130 [Nonomuraea sp. NPDC050733]|uniref:hypothetical protein n=1 Tax=Nonomuraea sp. NPDC050733 TaxID=3154633 RepID=UPI00340767F1
MGRPSDGYDASASGIHRRAEEVREEAEYASALRDELFGAFAREGRPMGNDVYGAELDKSFPGLRDAIFNEFDAYIGELGHTHEDMRTSAKHYDIARRQSER